MKLRKTVYFKIDIILEQNLYIWKFTYCMIRFGIIRFGSVNDTEASVFGYSVFTRFDRPLLGAKSDLHYRNHIYSGMHKVDLQKLHGFIKCYKVQPVVERSG